MARIFNVHEAKTRLSELLQLAQAGEEVVIAKSGKAYARLVPIFAEGDRQPGVLKGRLEGDPMAALDEEELDDWS
jgi:prevent-host-death family protein